MVAGRGRAGGARPLRIGLLGAGTIARVHAGNLDQMPEARLVAVADVDAERAGALARPRHAAIVADLNALVERHALDAVLVCLPPFATGGVVAGLAGLGLHVYAEKPVALDLVSAMADLDAIRRAGVVAASGYMWRAAPVVARAREVLAGRRPWLVHGTVITATPPSVWWRDKTRSGGLLVELATHAVDLLRLFGGEPRRVTCTGATGPSTTGGMGTEEGSTVEHAAAVTIEFGAGAVGSLGAAHGTGGGRWSVDLVASDLHLALDFFPERLTGTVDGRPIAYEAESLPGIVPHGFSGSAAWFLSLRRFVQAALDGRPDDVAATFEEGVRTLALTLACERSLAAGGTPVDVAHVV